ncbi:MAG: hypothetical protein WA121_03070, partial [Syntrophales bacterium]
MQEIKPLKNLDATVRLPGSKSYTQRAMVIAALAQGESTLRNVLVAEDTLYLKEALRALGAEIKENGDILIIQGTEGHIKCPEQVLFLGNNGTALRFLTTVAALGSGRFVLT